MENFEDFYQWLDGFINFEKRPHTKAFCLDVIKYYATLLSEPQTAYKSVHIAGSKGKGSVAAMFSALLTETGYQTGLYTSPHVNDFRERITENGRFFSDNGYFEAFRTVQETIDLEIAQSKAPLPSWFELVTLTAFVLFRQQRLDWAVFETGMGGRLDATNIVQPEITMLTPIELEHCEYLGSSISLIAAEKAGIIKRNVPVFCSRQPEKALTVFRKHAKTCGAPFFYIPELIEKIKHRLTGSGLEVSIDFSAGHPIGALFSRPIRTELRMPATVQSENAALAAATFKYCYPDTPEELIERGLSKAWLPARFQILNGDPLIALDGAHTFNSIQTCAETFFSLTDKKAALVFACAKDKSPEAFAPVFLGKVSHLYLTIPGAFKQGNLDKTVCAFTRVFKNEDSVLIESSEDFNTVLKKAFETSFAENRPLLITGSFYLAGEAQRVYSDEDFRDREMRG